MTFLPDDGFQNNESASQGRRPRGIVTIDGVPVKWVEIEVVTGALFYIAGNYRVTIPLNTQPGTMDLNFWASTERFEVRIYMGFPEDPEAYDIEDLDLMMVGDNNEVEIDPLSATVWITGRDLTSRLIDSKVTRTFSNNTASQVAQIFATENNLKTEITPTSKILGSFSQTAQTLFSNNTTQWDILVDAAQFEEFVIYVDGETLVFKPRPLADGSSTPYVLSYIPPNSESASPMFNGMDIKFSVNNVISGNVSVTVKVPYSYQYGEAFSVKAKSKNMNSRRQTSTTRKYVYTYPGLNRQQALQKAENLLTDLTIHGAKIYASVPGDNLLTKDGLVQVTGTNSALDQIYYPDEIRRTLNFSDGYNMHISAKQNRKGTEISA